MAVLASGLWPSYSWGPPAGPSRPTLPMHPSRPIFFTALLPLLSTDRSTKCFPSLLANFSPLSELFPLVNSFLARGGQPCSGASEHGAGRRCAVGGRGERGEHQATWARSGLWGLLSALMAAVAARRSFSPHFNLLKPFFEKATCAESLGSKTISNWRPK